MKKVVTVCPYCAAFLGEMLTKNSLSTDLTCRYPGDVTALEKMSPQLAHRYVVIDH
jgi:hypothetical protein